MSDAEDELAFQIKAAKLPVPEREHRFHPIRRWRFDFAWPAWSLALEIDGGGFVGGRHGRGRGIEADCEKTSEAAILGWQILRVSPDMVRDGRALAFIERWFAAYNNG